MSPVIFYLLKMLLCSGILWPTIIVALRNNRFSPSGTAITCCWLRCCPAGTAAITGCPCLFQAKKRAVITGLHYTHHYPAGVYPEGAFGRPRSELPGGNVVRLMVRWMLLLLARTAYGCWKIRRLIRNNPGSICAPTALYKATR